MERFFSVTKAVFYEILGSVCQLELHRRPIRLQFNMPSPFEYSLISILMDMAKPYKVVLERLLTIDSLADNESIPELWESKIGQHSELIELDRNTGSVVNLFEADFLIGYDISMTGKSVTKSCHW